MDDRGGRQARGGPAGSTLRRPAVPAPRVPAPRVPPPRPPEAGRAATARPAAPPGRAWSEVRTRGGGRHRLQGVLTAAMVVLGVVAAVVVARQAAPPSTGTAARGAAGSGSSLGSAGLDVARTLRGAVALDPRGHRAQGCLALAPAGEPRGTVVLDAGHGAPDPGASGRTVDGRPVDEADVTLGVVLVAAEQLRAAGIRVVLTRAGPDLGARLGADRFTDGVLTTAGLREQLTARARCANLARADALVSVHLNSAEDPDVRGSETLFDPNRTFSVLNRELASTLHRSVLEGLARAGRPAVDRGLAGGSGVARGDLVLLAPASARVAEPSEVPGALVEPLFLSHREEASFAASTEGRAVLAGAIADGAVRYLDALSP